jgi:protein-S-isoprenylcysteine O-methyltransferase Ste14
MVVAFFVVFVIWAVFHSITAAADVKSIIRDRIGTRAYDGVYRLSYNLFATLTFAPVLFISWQLLPQQILWQIPSPFHWLAIGVQVIGLAGLAIALWQTDVWEFIGLRQFRRYLREETGSPPQPLIVKGTYALVRHPIYFFSLLALWFNPVMSAAGLIFNLAATVYFWVGSIYEERRLEKHFGEAYVAYRQRVPRLLPIKWPW